MRKLCLAGEGVDFLLSLVISKLSSAEGHRVNPKAKNSLCLLQAASLGTLHWWDPTLVGSQSLGGLQHPRAAVFAPIEVALWFLLWGCQEASLISGTRKLKTTRRGCKLCSVLVDFWRHVKALPAQVVPRSCKPKSTLAALGSKRKLVEDHFSLYSSAWTCLM